MSKVQMLRTFVNQRLTAAAEEIFELFERTIAEYEEELCRSHKVPDADLNPEVLLHRADIQHVLSKEEVRPERQDWNPSLDQGNLQEPPHIKQEQEELWTNQEGEQLQGLEDADIIKFTFTSVPVKSEEDDEEKPQSSKLHQRITEEPEPARILNPDRHLTPFIHYPTSRSSESQTDDSRFVWDEINEPHSGLNPLQNNEVHVSNTGNTSHSSECATSFGQKEQLQKHRIQTEVKPFRCSICGKRFPQKIYILTHMRTHTGEKPFCCSYCGAGFTQSSNLTSHLKVHTREKPFTCSVCKASFSIKKSLIEHMRIHTGEKPFNCSLCGKRFAQKGHMRRHLSVHTGEKPFLCSVCGKGFAQNVSLKKHSMVHTGEKPFSCNICEKRFTRLEYVKNHKCLGESSRKK
uniref:zinc finger protein 135-like n=1 Tax=Semicossyphus pulcher TaxID=241346 RepID=UPI0037E887D0